MQRLCWRRWVYAVPVARRNSQSAAEERWLGVMGGRRGYDGVEVCLAGKVKFIFVVLNYPLAVYAFQV